VATHFLFQALKCLKERLVTKEESHRTCIAVYLYHRGWTVLVPAFDALNVEQEPLQPYFYFSQSVPRHTCLKIKISMLEVAYLSILSIEIYNLYYIAFLIHCTFNRSSQCTLRVRSF
jgi:hypothetical protein